MLVRNSRLSTILAVCAYTLIICGAVLCQKPKHVENEMSKATFSNIMVPDSIMMRGNTKMADSSMKTTKGSSRNKFPNYRVAFGMDIKARPPAFRSPDRKTSGRRAGSGHPESRDVPRIATKVAVAKASEKREVIFT